MNENVLNEARMIIAGFLKQRRLELKISEAQLASAVGMEVETIRRIESGHIWMSMKQYLQICSVLHLFPAIAEMESDTDIANALRQNWNPNPKAMSIEDAIKLKGNKYNNEGQHN